jgi:hypothetical protein
MSASIVNPSGARSVIWIAFTILLYGAPSGFADETTSAPVTTTPSRTEPAAGALEDTLEACLARIPKDATAGQRMMAEQSCRRAEAERHSVQTFDGR